MHKPGRMERRRLKNMSVCILSPVGGYHVWGRFARSTANMIAYSWMHGLPVYQWGMTERMVVDWARNSLARQARDYECEYTGKPFTHLLWLDDDMLFGPDLAVWLAQHADLDMVSAVYYGRTERHLPVAYLHDKTDDEHRHFPLVGVPEALCRVDAVGFGALLMRRDVLDRVPEPWFTLDWRSGEDIAFCVEAKKAGIEIYLDGRYKCGHIGDPQVVTSKTYEQYMEDHREELGEKVRVEL